MTRRLVRVGRDRTCANLDCRADIFFQELALRLDALTDDGGKTTTGGKRVRVYYCARCARELFPNDHHR